MENKTEFLTAKEVATRLGLEIWTFRRLVASGELPTPYQVGKKTQVWSEDDVQGMVWLLKNTGRFGGQTPEEEEKWAE